VDVVIPTAAARTPLRHAHRGLNPSRKEDALGGKRKTARGVEAGKTTESVMGQALGCTLHAGAGEDSGKYQVTPAPGLAGCRPRNAKST